MNTKTIYVCEKCDSEYVNMPFDESICIIHKCGGKLIPKGLVFVDDLDNALDDLAYRLTFVKDKGAEFRAWREELKL